MDNQSHSSWSLSLLSLAHGEGNKPQELPSASHCFYSLLKASHLVSLMDSQALAVSLPPELLLDPKACPVPCWLSPGDAYMSDDELHTPPIFNLVLNSSLIYIQFTGEETGEQRGKVICPNTQLASKEAETDLLPRRLCLSGMAD